LEGQKSFLFAIASGLVLSLGLEWPGREADNWLLSGAEVNRHSPICLHGVVLY